jgi:hypothetical protein
MKKKLIPVVAVILLISCMLTSCLYGIKGNRNVVKNERQLESFTSISVSAGLEVILSQDSIPKVIVEADSNLQDIIKTEVSGGELKIFPKQRISSCESKKIFVTFKTIQGVEASSGSDVKSKVELKLQSLQLSVSSGANVDVKLGVSKLTVNGSSGANVDLAGNTEILDVDGSSGSNIKAKELQSKSCNAGASSGANLKLFVSEKINAQASSGGNIKVAGNPKERNIQKSSGGNVDFN